jgi:hypothetical protein
MIGRQELVVTIAALLLLAMILLAVLVVRRSQDHIALFDYALLVIGPLAFFFVYWLPGLIVFGLGLIVLAIRLPKRGDSAERFPCPFCAEDIRPEAIVCPHCRHDL